MMSFRHSLSLCLALLLTFLSSPLLLHAEEKQMVDAIAAIVNSEVITTSQVRMLGFERELNLRQTVSGEELEKQLKELYHSELNDMIDRTLIIQEFHEKGFFIPDYALENGIENIIRIKYGGDRLAFLKMLQSRGITLSLFKKQQKDTIIVQTMMSDKLKNTYLVPPASIRTYYENHTQEFSTPEMIKLRMIALHQEEGAELDDSKKEMADEIHQKLAEGAEFDRMAQMYSDDSTQDSGGDWGWIEKNTLNPKLSEEAFSLKKGEVSPVLEVDHSYYILMVEDKKAAAVKSFTEVRPQIERKLLEEERVKNQKSWLEELRKKAYIKIYNPEDHV